MVVQSERNRDLVNDNVIIIISYFGRVAFRLLDC